MPRFMERAFLLELGVPKDCIDKVLQVYHSCYGHILSRDTGMNEPPQQNDRRKGGMKRYLAGVLGIGIVIGRIDIPMRKG